MQDFDDASRWLIFDVIAASVDKGAYFDRGLFNVTLS